MADPHRLRRLFAGASMLAAPALYVTGIVLDPALRSGNVPGAYGRHPEWVSASAAVLHWSWVILVPGIIGMVHLIRERGVLFGHIAGGLALLGIVNFSALMFGDFFYSRLEAEFGADEGSRLADEAYAYAGAAFGFQIPGFLGLLGVLLLGLGLAYGRRAPWWAPFAMIVGILVGPVFPIGTLVGGVLYFAGAGVIGMRMLRMSDAEWSGFTPLAAQAESPSTRKVATA